MDGSPTDILVTVFISDVDGQMHLIRGTQRATLHTVTTMEELCRKYISETETPRKHQRNKLYNASSSN